MRGRDAIKERLKNSRLCGRPFNNRIVKNGIETYLPTLWILDTCPRAVSNMKSWAWDEWATRDALITKDEKNKPQQKNSHFPMVLEGLFKHPGFNIGRYRNSVLPVREPAYRNAFSGRM